MGRRIPAIIIVNIIFFPLKFSLEITNEAIDATIRLSSTAKVATMMECIKREGSLAFIIAL